jgi:hypothetical protein
MPDAYRATPIGRPQGTKLGPVLSCDELFTQRIGIKGGTPFFGGFPNQLLTDSWVIGSKTAQLRAVRCSATCAIRGLKHHQDPYLPCRRRLLNHIVGAPE